MKSILRFRKRSPVTVTLLASAIFLGLAVYVWDLPAQNILNTLLVLFFCLLAIVVLALLSLVLFKLIRRLIG